MAADLESGAAPWEAVAARAAARAWADALAARLTGGACWGLGVGLLGATRCTGGTGTGTACLGMCLTAACLGSVITVR